MREWLFLLLITMSRFVLMGNISSLTNSRHWYWSLKDVNTPLDGMKIRSLSFVFKKSQKATVPSTTTYVIINRNLG